MTADVEWNYDITQAPTDGSPIWAACANGEVVKSGYSDFRVEIAMTCDILR